MTHFILTDTEAEEEQARHLDEQERLRAIGIANAWLGRATGRRWRGNHPEQALLLAPPYTLYDDGKWHACWYPPDVPDPRSGPAETFAGSTWACALYRALCNLLPNDVEDRFYAYKEKGRYHADWIEAE